MKTRARRSSPTSCAAHSPLGEWSTWATPVSTFESTRRQAPTCCKKGLSMSFAISVRAVASALLAFVFVQAVAAQSSVPTYIKDQSMSLFVVSCSAWCRGEMATPRRCKKYS
jgi:hypothetical protein